MAVIKLKEYGSKVVDDFTNSFFPDDDSVGRNVRRIKIFSTGNRKDSNLLLPKS